MTKVSIKHGKEGPDWDPYGYTEITVYRNGQEWTLHLGGLDVWHRIGKKGTGALRVSGDDGFSEYEFERLTGASWDKWERWHYRSKLRCPKCFSKKSSWMNGYPGEQIKVCDNCGSAYDCTFDESAII